jgi:NTP pyrophosphatase (non-canonical NTP hydrolase)
MNQDLTRSVKRFHKEFGLTRRNQSPELWLCMMTEELGELMRAVLRGQSKEEVEDELGDMLYVMAGFCQLFGYDLQAGVERVVRKNDVKHRGDFSPAAGGKVQRRSQSARKKR